MNSEKWSKWSSIAEIVSSIAILVTLVYLSIQTNQNSQMLTSQAQFNLMQNRNSWAKDIVGTPGVAELLVKMRNSEQLSDVELFKAQQLSNSFFAGWEFEYLQAAAGSIDLPVEGYRAVLRNPGIRALWDESSFRYNKDFVSFFNSNVIQ